MIDLASTLQTWSVRTFIKAFTGFTSIRVFKSNARAYPDLKPLISCQTKEQKKGATRVRTWVNGKLFKSESVVIATTL
jgi:hypothetical protein